MSTELILRTATEKMGYERVGEANWRMGLFYLYEKKI